MRLSSRAAVLSVLALVSVTACIETMEPHRERTGFISVPAFRDGSNNVFIRPIAAFYKYNGIALNQFVNDTCFFAAYSPVAPTVANLPSIEAGAFLTTFLPGRQDTLTQVNAFGVPTTYQLQSVPYMTYTPGDTLRVEAPGQFGGFPATSIRVRTAEAFTFNDPDTASRGVSMPLTWTAGVSAGSRMQVSLRFASSVAATAPDVQLYCDLIDDGSYSVNATNADVFRSSQYEFRSWLATRSRTSIVEHSSETRAYLISLYSQPLALYEPPT